MIFRLTGKHVSVVQFLYLAACDKIFRKFRRKTPEWMADFEKPCFSLELEIFKSKTNDGEPAPAVETPSTTEISNQDGNRKKKKLS